MIILLLIPEINNNNSNKFTSKLQLKILAIDTNKNACNLTLENAQNLKLDDRLTVINATLQEDGTIKNSSEENSLDFKEKTFDFIISNPPYVSTKQVFKLMPEIKL